MTKEQRQKYNKAYSKSHRKEISAQKSKKYWEDPEKFRACSRAYTRARPEMIRAHVLKQKYGLTLAEYQKLVDASQGVCAICKKVFASTPHVDHNHVTGKIRGLLCSQHNTALGLFKDDTTVMWEAIKYVVKHRS